MRAKIKQGAHLLSFNEFNEIGDTLIVNFTVRWALMGWEFYPKKNLLEMHTIEGIILMVFSAPVKQIEIESFDKDQAVYKIIKG